MSPSTTRNNKCQTTTVIPTAKNAERERSRVRSLRSAFQSLQACLPSVPPDTKLSKLDILILATNYIAQLMATLETSSDEEANGSENLKLITTDRGCFSTGSKLATVALPPSSILQSYYHPMKKWPMRSRLYSLVLATNDQMNISSAENQTESISEESDFNNNANSTSPSMLFDQTSFSCSEMTFFHDFDETMRGDGY